MNEEKSPSQIEAPVFMAIDAPPRGPGTAYPLKPWTEQVDVRLEAVASILARGISAQRIRRAAAKLGVPVSHVRLWLKDPHVIRRAAQYGTAMSLGAQVKKAQEGDTLAFKTVAQIGSLIESGGPKVQINNAVDARSTGNNESDKGFFQQFRKRVEKRIEQPD